MKIILADPNLVHTFFGNYVFDTNYGEHPLKTIIFWWVLN